MTMLSSVTECDCSTLLIGGVITLAVIYFLKSRRPKNFPPGPPSLPIVGYAPFIGDNVADKFMKMRSKYGPVMSVQMGMEDWVVLNGYDAINEALVKQGEKFSGRPQNFVFEIYAENSGIATVDYGPVWKNLRKFGLMSLRGFGVGKKGMEENIIEETPLLLEHLTDDTKHAIMTKISQGICNIICRVLFGSRYAYDDKRLVKILDIFKAGSEDTLDNKLVGIMTAAPQLRFIPGFKGALERTVVMVNDFMDVFREMIDEQRKTFDKNDTRHIIDAFLIEIDRRGGNDPSFNEKQLVHLIRDFFEAGTVTTASTLTWALLVFLNYPDIQEKVAHEVHDVIGESGLPTMKHREQMPYTCAFIQELMRHRLLVPTSLFHKTNAEAVLNGYTIPKNTTIIPNLWSIHFDPELFKNPEEFKPDRFLDEEGKFVKSNHVVPFSIGPRHCVGEQLARMEIFIFLTGIVQKLKVLPDPDYPPPPITQAVYQVFNTYEAPDFRVKFENR